VIKRGKGMKEESKFNFLRCQKTGIWYLDDSFPKKCGYCGITYSDHEDFINRTKEPQRGVFVKFNPVLTMEYRHCKCGSTLVCLVKTRRDVTAEGAVKRQQFDDAMEEMVTQGISEEDARKTLQEIILYTKSIGIYQSENDENKDTNSKESDK
jgi:hypothetical protein